MDPLIIPGLFELGKQLIEKLIPDPEAKAKAQADLAQMALNGELAELSESMKAILAEAQSPDPWTSRARPSFLYVFYFIIIVMVVVAPIIGIFFTQQMGLFYTNVNAGFMSIPEAMWWTFSTGYLGYSGLRTIGKIKGVEK